MTNTIQPYNYSSTPQTSDSAPAGNKPVAAKSTQSAAVVTEGESVTLSAAAQANAALVGAARGANGIDQAHVDAIKAALANGTYNVSPEDLANAISSVLSETRE